MGKKTDHNGHGTEMAGVALYYDLKDKLSTSDTVDVYHHLESVKIFRLLTERMIQTCMVR